MKRIWNVEVKQDRKYSWEAKLENDDSLYLSSKESFNNYLETLIHAYQKINDNLPIDLVKSVLSENVRDMCCEVEFCFKKGLYCFVLEIFTKYSGSVYESKPIFKDKESALCEALRIMKMINGSIQVKIKETYSNEENKKNMKEAFKGMTGEPVEIKMRECDDVKKFIEKLKKAEESTRNTSTFLG